MRLGQACRDGGRSFEQRLPYLPSAKNKGIIILPKLRDQPYVLTLANISYMQCDEKRPECGQCLRSKYACAGYYREAIFYNASTDDRPDEALTDLTLSVQRPFNKVEVKRSLLPTTSASFRNGLSTAKRRKATRSKNQAFLPRAIDDREIIKLSFFYSFLQLYLPDLGRCNVGREQPLVSWFLIVPELLQPGDLLSRTLTSLAMARLGHKNHDRSLSMQARTVWASAVARLQMALNDKSLVCREETLATCLALALFEVCISSNMLSILLDGY